MRKAAKLAELAQLTDLDFAQASMVVQKIAQQEAALRARHKDLEQLRKEADNGTVETLTHRLSGTDVLYQVWLGRQMAAINAELARLIAAKHAHMKQLKRAYGKKEVATKLVAQQSKIRRPGVQGW